MTRTIRNRRRFVVAAMSAALVAGLATSAGAQQAEPKKITVAFKANENNLTPFTLTMGGLPTTHDLTNLVYDTLFWSQVREDPEPWLATSAEPSPDYKSWTVKLRPGVLWHDGRPLTAEDVKFTYEKMKTTTGGRYSHHVWEYPVFMSADVIDPLTVRLNFEDAAPTFKILPGGDLPIVPKHVWENVPNPTTGTNVPSIGSGPFKMVEVVPDQMYKLEANAAYFKGKPKVDAIDVPIVKDPGAAFAALQTGQIDALDRTVPPELYDQLSKAPGIKVVESTRMESVHLHFNNRKAPLNDPRVRKGITLAIDNNALVQTVLLGRGQPGRDGWVHPASAWADPQGRHEFDVARANRTLDEAGFRRGDDGVRRTPEGNPLQFNITVAANEPQHQRAAQVISQQVEAIGVKMQVEAIDPATLRQRRGNLNYDSFITNLESHAHADPDALSFFFHSPVPNAPSAGSFGAYSNPQFDSLVEKARSSVNLDERKRLLHEAQRIFAQDAPALVLFYPNGDYAYRTAAYDGWIADTGHGILTKRSFLQGYEKSEGGVLGGSTSDDAPPWAAIGVGLAIVGVGAGLLIARNRRRDTLEPEEA
jgi:peptide/nickel transport system substrate-binding protein